MMFFVENVFKNERVSPPPQPVLEVNLPTGIDLKKERPPKEDIQNKMNKSCTVCQVLILINLFHN